MNTVSYTHVRASFASTMDQVCNDHAPVIITRSALQTSVVMMSLADYQALEETAYLLRSPANARRLLRSIEQIELGRTTKRQLIESESLTPASA